MNAMTNTNKMSKALAAFLRKTRSPMSGPMNAPMSGSASQGQPQTAPQSGLPFFGGGLLGGLPLDGDPQSAAAFAQRARDMLAGGQTGISGLLNLFMGGSLPAGAQFREGPAPAPNFMSAKRSGGSTFGTASGTSASGKKVKI